ncbi:MAG: diaminobutyrate acetyltransferase [Planctomycetota bacterium]
MTDKNSDTITMRKPGLHDGPAIHQLISRCPPLDVNTVYAYCILADHHSDTIVVAEDAELGIVGCITAYKPPTKPDTLFIWQVAVDERRRGLGLAGRMLDHLLARPACANITGLETTVSPDNIASRRVFEKLAATAHVELQREEYLVADEAGPGHAAEELLRITPLPPR